MKTYWRRPYQFWTDLKLAVEAQRMVKPPWFALVERHPPGQHSTVGRKPWPKLEFPQDTYRRLYYADYPHELKMHAHSTFPGDRKYLQTPMDIFLERHWQLTKQGVDGDVAYLQCQEEKAAREFTLQLEKYFCVLQAANITGLDTNIVKENPFLKLTPYEKARAWVVKSRRDRLTKLIDQRKAEGIEFRITDEDCAGMSDLEIFDYVRAHPEDAKYFDETVFFEEDPFYIEYEIPQKPEILETGHDITLRRHFGLSDPTKIDELEGKALHEYTDNDLQQLQTKTAQMIQEMSIEYGVSLDDDNLFDTLSESGRHEILSAWSQAYPEAEEILHQPFYSSNMVKYLRQYQDRITRPAELDKASLDERKPGFKQETIDKTFSKYYKADEEQKDRRKLQNALLDDLTSDQSPPRT